MSGIPQLTASCDEQESLRLEAGTMTQGSLARASSSGQPGSTSHLTSHLTDTTNQQHAKSAACKVANEKLKMKKTQAASKVDCSNQALVSCLSVELLVCYPLH